MFIQVSLIDLFLLQVQKFLAEHERVVVVAASTLIMSFSHTALRPVLPVFAKVLAHILQDRRAAAMHVLALMQLLLHVCPIGQ